MEAKLYGLHSKLVAGRHVLMREFQLAPLMLLPPWEVLQETFGRSEAVRCVALVGRCRTSEVEGMTRVTCQQE
eukprot:6218450-Amphidinium_carterae.1